MNKTAKVITAFFVLIFLSSSYMLLKGHHEQHRFDANKMESRRTDDYISTLRCYFEGWKVERLPLSENFRKKIQK